MKVFSSITEIIGNTPLVRIGGYEKSHALDAKILAKIEYLNPAGSVKDRIAASMIADAEKRGLLFRGGTVIEPTSGNTGIALAAVCAAKGYRLIVTMPETMSVERRNMIAAYGAKIVLTDGKFGMPGAIKKADELKAQIDGAVILGQFVNPANPHAHYDTTGPEIWRDTDGNIDIFVAGVGTGGTLSGTGKYLKERDPKIKIVAVEPQGSQVLGGSSPGAHKIQGIGAGFIPDTLDTAIYDEVIPITDCDAFAAAKQIGQTDGILVGISSGAALHAATVLAKRRENADKTIVVLLPDGADRYYSTPLFDHE